MWPAVSGSMPPAKRQKMSSADGQDERPSAMDKVVDIVPDMLGDMVIEVDKDGDVGKIRVHKLLMMLASPVFKTMLDGSFQEATRTFGDNDPLVFPDDVRKPFTSLCKIIHMQPLEPQTVFEQGAEIAVLADEYRCAKKTLAPVVAQLRALLEDSETALDPAAATITTIKDLLCIAYIMEDQNLLWRTARHLVMHKTPKDLAEDWHSTLQLLAAPVIGKRYERCHNICILTSLGAVQEVQKAELVNLEQTCGNFRKLGYPMHKKTLGMMTCDVTYERVGRFVFGVVKMKKGKEGSLDECDISLKDAWESYRKLAISLDMDVDHERCRRTDCPEALLPISQRVEAAVADSKSRVRGVCLECLQVGSPSGRGDCKYCQARSDTPKKAFRKTYTRKRIAG